MNVYREHQHENTVVYAWKDEDFEFPAHWHTQVEIVAVLSGSLQAQVNGTTYYAEKGDVLLCGSNEIHSYIKSQCRILLIIISPSFIEGITSILQNNTLLNHLVRKEKLNKEAKFLIERIDDAYSGRYQVLDEIETIIFNGYCLSLLGHLLANLDYKSEIDKVKLNLYDYMCRGLDYINKHYCDESICLQEIAKNIGISPCYFSRCFKMYSGYRLAEYINRKRVKKAEKMLKETDKKITDISMECGYGSLRNFNRVYKEITGNTPQQMREKHLVNKDENLRL